VKNDGCHIDVDGDIRWRYCLWCCCRMYSTSLVFCLSFEFVNSNPAKCKRIILFRARWTEHSR